MRTNDPLDFVKRQPFEPFRVTLTDGRTFDVHHPELTMVGKSAVAIGIPASDEQGPVYDRLVTVSLLHVMQIEPIQPSPHGDNGRHK